MLVLILYNVFAIPVSLCFSLEVAVVHPWFWVELFFDFIFLVDCFVINFNTAVQTDSGLSTNRCVIAREYFAFWFWIDFSSSIPLSQCVTLAAFASGQEPGESAQVLESLRLIRIARILKLIRLLKAAKIFRIMEDELDINVRALARRARTLTRGSTSAHAC